MIQPRWVRLTGLTEFSCLEVLKEPGRERFFATDRSHQRVVLVTIKTRDGSCGPLPEPVSGILKKAGPSLPEWLRDKGMQVPPSSYQLMELEFGGDASSARFEVYMGLTVLLFGVICSIMSLSMLSRLRKTAAIS